MSYTQTNQRGRTHERRPAHARDGAPAMPLAALGSAVILALARGARTFDELIHSTGTGQAPLIGALSEMRGDGWVEQTGSAFRLSPRGRELVARCRH